MFTYAHVKWFYGQSERAYYLNYFYNIALACFSENFLEVGSFLPVLIFPHSLGEFDKINLIDIATSHSTTEQVPDKIIHM